VIVGLALSPSLDVTYVVDELRLGHISAPTIVVRAPGGKTLNAARVAANLGSPVTVVAALGGFTGAQVAGLLDRSGIALTVVDAGGETRTCISISSGADTALTELYEAAEPFGDGVWARCLAALDAAAPDRGDWLIVAGSVPAGVPVTELAATLRRYRDRGVRIAVDCHGPALAAIVDGRAADLVKVNRSEAEALLGAPSAGLAERLAAASGATAVVTDGINGSFAAGQGWALRVAPDSVTGAFAVGSGDSYFGGLVHELHRGVDFDGALLTAASCASANAMQPGAAIIDLDSVARARTRIIVSARIAVTA
jgi:1-phosphofructokinase family hexose kinase